jgi:hypothetical protein
VLEVRIDHATIIGMYASISRQRGKSMASWAKA